MNQQLLRKSWQKLWPSFIYANTPNKENQRNSVLEPVQHILGCEEATFNYVDESLLEDNRVLTDQEIVKMVIQECDNNSEKSNSEADGTTEWSVSHVDASCYSRRHHVFKTLVQYCINLQVFITLPEKYNRLFKR